MDSKIPLLPLITSHTLNIAACNHLATMIVVVGDHKYCKKSQETIIFSLLSIVENVFSDLNEFCMCKNHKSSLENKGSKERNYNPKSYGELIIVY